MSDNIKAKRVPVRIPVGVYLKDRPHDVIDAEILDISEGGAFVQCNAPIALGQEVILEIRFAETKILEGKVIEHEAVKESLPANLPQNSVIRWAKDDEKAGFGIEFLGLKPDKKKFLAKLVQYFEQLDRAGVTFKARG